MSPEGKLLFDLLVGINQAYAASLHAGQATSAPINCETKFEIFRGSEDCEICGAPLALASETICSKCDMENDERRSAPELPIPPNERRT
jgi:hypothetical protein